MHPVEFELVLDTFAGTLIDWQKRAGRHDLPWQNTRDPYRIWLSEIMLQQTQVQTVIPYYTRFLARFPTVDALANATQEEVLALWAGLGYYARGRNLHACARQVMAVHAGIFPTCPAELEALPGIGRSTAAAIAAFSAGVRAAILDGNVKRVLSRYFALSAPADSPAQTRHLWALAERLLPEQAVDVYTQALMDLGATVCTRTRPNCLLCPLAETCLGKAQGRPTDFPGPKTRRERPAQTTAFVWVHDGARLLLERRPSHGLWGGLLVPPQGTAAVLAASWGMALQVERPLPPLKHRFTHFDLTIESEWCATAPGVSPHPDLVWVPWAEVADAGLPTPMRRLFETALSLIPPVGPVLP